MDYKRRSSRQRQTKIRTAGKRQSDQHSNAAAVKLFICLTTVLLAVLTKTIFPSFSERVKYELLPVIEGNSDYMSAFAAMGSFFSGSSSFNDAFDDMLAFLFLADSAVKTDAAPSNTLFAATPRAHTAPITNMARDTLAAMYDSLAPVHIYSGSLDSAADSPPDSFQETESRESEDLTEALYYSSSSEQDDIVTSFLESQALFSEYDIPSDVITDKLPLPFEYSSPVDGINSSGFGFRLHPIDDIIKFHYGTDFDASVGQNIYAFADATVVVSAESDILGKYLILSHGDGFTTQYFHCSSLIAQSGDWVNRGDIIAEVGDTGYSTGPHLHFELILNGFYLNPEYYLGD